MTLVKLCCEYNRPTSLAVMGADRLDYSNSGATELASLSSGTRDFLKDLERATAVPVEFVGTGLGTFHSIHTDIMPIRSNFRMSEVSLRRLQVPLQLPS